uniref:Zgc:195212 n=1 Tax=Sinocyclocheilus rhinocerous TaxID=307959 RepID=A0A673G6N3_9TELE
GSKVSVMDHSITIDTAKYGQSPFSVRCLPSCPQMHPVLGDTLSCVLPTDTIEAGLCGEMNMVTMATPAPCMDQYSNWPTRLSCIRISFSMPLMQQTQTSFLQTSLSWADLGLSRVCCMGAQSIQGSLCSDVEFSLETDYSQETRCSYTVQQNIESEWSHAVEQTLTVFIFAQYSDPFRSQISDFISDEEVFERHLDAVLWYNGDQVRVTLQSTLKNTLKECQQRLDSVIPIVCKKNLKLGFIVDGRFAPRRVCSNEKVLLQTYNCSHFILKIHQLSSKRIHCDLQYSSFIPKKRQSSEMFSENSDTFMNSVFEAANIQRNPLSPKQIPQSQPTRMITDKPSALSLAKLKNEQVEKQWLQELENFSEWD